MIIFTGLQRKSTTKQLKSFGKDAIKKEVYTKRNTKGSTVLVVKDILLRKSLLMGNAQIIIECLN
jgi:hypothetical protein